MFRVRDFVETEDGLLFSVISNLHPPEGIVAHLRFRRSRGSVVKLGSSGESHQFLREHAPGYLRFCPELDRKMTIVPYDKVLAHHEPAECLSRMMRTGEDPEVVAIVSTLTSKAGLPPRDLGITGSYLVGAQTPSSDVDLVVYGLHNYPRLTRALRGSVEHGMLQPFDPPDWEGLFQRRSVDPAIYRLDEFVWHEARKWNRGKFGRRRFDILSARTPEEISGRFGKTSYRRLGKARVDCIVEDSSMGFDYPARYLVTECVAMGHEVREIVSFTHTYADQARSGERVHCSGILEEVSGKEKSHRILVGSSREAPGEFLKVAVIP
jgi:predicted nucleotidyltransferase